MIISWGDDLLDTTQGLDILGVRGIDQNIELGLVNGITTVSQRARYFSILPWALGDYLVSHTSEGCDWDSLTSYLRRVEFMVLAASQLDKRINGADASGALGADLQHKRLTSLLDDGIVTFPDNRGGALLGTYLAPCRAIGLVLDGDAIVPYKLSLRGKQIWEERRERLANSPVMTAISDGTEISRSLIEAAIPDFSLGTLAASTDEARLLYDAFVTPWEPEDEYQRNQVTEVYDSFNGTIAWINAMLTVQPESAPDLIVRNFKSCTLQEGETTIAYRWAEYEYLRRCHFALELLLSALTRSLVEFEEAGIAQIVSGWFEDFEASPLLNEFWPAATEVIESTAFGAVESIPKGLFSEEPIPISDLRGLPRVDQAFIALAILVATAEQTRDIRRGGHFDLRLTSTGERAVNVTEGAGEEPFTELMEKLVELTALSHLQTTLRKMGAGQKCSLRFFPDGPLLRPTGISIVPGHSNTRLTNVLRILTDIGKLRRLNGKFTPAE